jgi:murein DD-endopeptidase MepM/ murein hydrolase activator NlpD
MGFKSWNQLHAVLPGKLADFQGSMTYLMGKTAVAITNRFALHRLFRLRQRYIMSRCGRRVRLRYSTVMAVVFMTALFTAIGKTETSSALAIAQMDAPAQAVASIEPASGSETFGPELTEGAIAPEAEATPRLQQIAMTVGNVAEAIKNVPKIGPQQQVVEVGSGDTVAGVLEKSGVNGKEAYQIVEALKEHVDPRKVKAGQEIKLTLDRVDEGFELTELKMMIDPVKEVIVSKEDKETFAAAIHEKEVKQLPYTKTASIETSLYGSAMKAGIPAGVIAEVIRIYSWDVDFQRDIREGDKIEVLYDSYETEDGEYARSGEVLYANLTVGGRDVPIYRFKTSAGDVDYFEEDGHSIRKALMKTPVDGARLSSGFGMRKHPILGYDKMHKGLDFAAPLGTPIYAAGDGTVEMAGRNGAYGNYVRIRHNSTLKTAYAHLHKFGKGISAGHRVKQGEIIGYIGTTGRSTGPHLHYEVHANGTQINPKSVDLPTGEQLKGGDMDRFKSAMHSLKQQYASLADGFKLAQHSAPKRSVH